MEGGAAARGVGLVSMAEVNFAEDAEDDRSSDQNTMAAAAGAAAGGASAGTTDDNNIAVKKYVCDVCEWAQFDTYEETCRHENGRRIPSSQNKRGL